MRVMRVFVRLSNVCTTSTSFRLSVLSSSCRHRHRDPPRAGFSASGVVFGVAEIFYHRVADITATGFIHINNQSELIDQTGVTHVSDHGNPWTRDHRFARQSYRRGGRHPRLRCARPRAPEARMTYSLLYTSTS